MYRVGNGETPISPYLGNEARSVNSSQVESRASQRHESGRLAGLHFLSNENLPLKKRQRTSQSQREDLPLNQEVLQEKEGRANTLTSSPYTVITWAIGARPNSTPPEKMDKVRRLLGLKASGDKTLTNAIIAKRAGVSESLVYKEKRKSNLPPSQLALTGLKGKRRSNGWWEPETIENAKKLIEQGWSRSDIASQMEVPAGTIEKWALQTKMSPKPREGMMLRDDKTVSRKGLRLHLQRN